MNIDFPKAKFLSRFGNIKASKEESDRMFRQFLWEEEERERMMFTREAEQAGGAGLTQDYMEYDYMIDAANYVD
jgi:hypothetical protein